MAEIQTRERGKWAEENLRKKTEKNERGPSTMRKKRKYNRKELRKWDMGKS
jgi:hypothetical protein